MLFEYVLNCCWLLLFVLAFRVWRQRTRCVRQRHQYSSQQCLVALLCAVFLLFPVISASDDLHAMRPEMEESSSSKRTLQQALNHRASTQCHSAPLVARLTLPLAVLPTDDTLDHVWHLQEPVPASIGLPVLSSRAPPSLSL